MVKESLPLAIELDFGSDRNRTVVVMSPLVALMEGRLKEHVEGLRNMEYGPLS